MLARRVVIVLLSCGGLVAAAAMTGRVPRAPEPAHDFVQGAARSGQQELAAATFDDGTLGPFKADPVGSVRVVDDPTGRSRGKVAEMRYVATRTPAEPAAALSFTQTSTLGLGSTVFFSGDLYIPDTTFNLDNARVTRMLLLFRAALGEIGRIERRVCRGDAQWRLRARHAVEPGRRVWRNAMPIGAHQSRSLASDRGGAEAEQHRGRPERRRPSVD